MNIAEGPEPRFINVSRLRSIKTKIIAFALLATIIPSLTLGTLSYFQNRRLLQGKIASQLRNATVQTSAEIDLWIKARFYDLKVFSSSYVVSENLQRILVKDRDNIERLVSINRIKTYLQSVRDKFSDYRELIIVNMIGEPLVTSGAETPVINLPANWFKKMENGRPIIGEAYWDQGLKRRVITLAEEITSSDNHRLGILATKVDLASIKTILDRKAAEGVDEIYLTDHSGKLIVSSTAIFGVPPRSAFAENLLISGATFPEDPMEYTSFRSHSVVGLGNRIPETDWAVFTEMRKSAVYADIIRLERITLMIAGILLVTMGIMAYLLGHAIVRPLKRLSGEAGKVALGDLRVDIPVQGSDEVSYLTQVFNHMVSNLRHGQSQISQAHEALIEKNRELHQLSITDGLTGLFNRKHMMDLFEMEFLGTRRYQRPFSVFIADIDHFKKINDTYGHLAGDAVLKRIADSLCQSVRETDHVGRYGGEEFLILLPATETDGAMNLARRICEAVRGIEFYNDGMHFSMTISVGVALCTHNDESLEAVLSRADEALYQAKANGRNQVIGP